MTLSRRSSCWEEIGNKDKASQSKTLWLVFCVILSPLSSPIIAQKPRFATKIKRKCETPSFEIYSVI